MDRLRVLIVEDNSLIAFELSKNIASMGHHVVDTVSTAYGAETVVEQQAVDMVILDINLKGDRDGISVAKFLDGKQIPFIFLTSYYDEATLDRVKETHFAAFIAKPYTELDLRLNIELARRRNQPVMEGHNTKFYTYTDNKMTKKIYYQDVLFIKSEDNYSIFHTKEKKEIIVRIPLKNLADELGDKRFFKIHRSYIINVDKIQSFSNNTVVIEGLQVPISSSHRKEFKEFINDLWS